MALNAYLRVTGETQGEIKGSVVQAGREDSILVVAWSHELGAPEGKKLSNTPFVVTKELDLATVGLYQALASNELLTDWTLRLWRPAPTGQEQQYFTIELFDANVSSIRAEMLNNRYPENVSIAERQHVAFTYQKIRWTWEDGGIVAEADGDF